LIDGIPNQLVSNSYTISTGFLESNFNFEVR